MTYEQMIKRGLNARDCVVLEKLEQGASTPTGLADELNSTANITLITNRLYAKGLINRRKKKAGDRRVIIITLTQKGRRVINE